MRHWMIWLLPLWEGRRHRRALAAAQLWQDEERRAAYQRIADAAAALDETTRWLPAVTRRDTPLLTRGQAVRSPGAGR